MVVYSASNQNRRLVIKRIMRLSLTTKPIPHNLMTFNPPRPFCPRCKAISAFYTLQIYRVEPTKMGFQKGKVYYKKVTRFLKIKYSSYATYPSPE